MSSSPVWRWLRPLLLAVACGVVSIGTWWFFVATRDGQRIDTLAYLGAVIGQHRVAGRLEAVLEVVSVGAIAVAIAAVMAVAVLRRRWWLALEAATVVAGANLSTRALKFHVLYRPHLLEYQGLHHNSYPSGHTTAAASAMVAALIVAPRGMRTFVAVLGSLVMVLFGYGTLAAQWHRPSDVVGGYLVCFTWAFFALFVAAARQQFMAGRSSTPAPVRTPPSRVAPAIMALAGCVALAIATWCGWHSWNVTSELTEDFHDRLVAYLGGAAGLSGVAVTGMAVLLRFTQLHESRSGRIL